MNLLRNFTLGLVLVLVSTYAYAKEIKINSNLKFYSNEEFVFNSKEEFPLSDMGKIPEYQGVLTLQSENAPQLAEAELYVFPNETKITLTEPLCKTYSEKIFGDFSKRKVAVKQAAEIFKTPTGSACATTLNDTNAKIRYHYTLTGFIHGQLTTLVWSLKSQPTAEKKQTLKNFYISLK